MVWPISMGGESGRRQSHVRAKFHAQCRFEQTRFLKALIFSEDKPRRHRRISPAVFPAAVFANGDAAVGAATGTSMRWVRRSAPSHALAEAVENAAD
jgi:hypothetical protein